MNTRKLVVEAGFKYDSDSYADDLPYWTLDYGEFPHLIIPYTLSENDMRFTAPNSFGTGGDFCKYLKDHLRFLVEEGRSGYPKMMSVGLHCRLARPGRVAGLAEFLDFVKSYGKDVWVCTREEIADFWGQPKQNIWVHQDRTLASLNIEDLKSGRIVWDDVEWITSDELFLDECLERSD